MQLSSRGIALATAALHVAAMNRAARAQTASRDQTGVQPTTGNAAAKPAVGTTTRS